MDSLKRKASWEEEQNVKRAKMEDNFRLFYEKYWPLIGSIACIDERPTDDEIRALRRGQWYCNLTERLIPELQPFNSLSAEELKDVKINDDSGSSDGDVLKEDTRNSMSKWMTMDKSLHVYRVYKCGHCYLDFGYMCAVFDYLHSQFSSMYELRSRGESAVHQWVLETLTPRLTKCAICVARAAVAADEDGAGKTEEKNRCWRIPARWRMYEIFVNLDVGTIVRMEKSIVPRKFLGAMANELEIGDVVDTTGYRGTGLYIYEGHRSFVSVRRGEYWPIWPLKYCQMRGYLYYLRNPHVQDTIDGIELPGGKTLYQTGYRTTEDRDNLPIYSFDDQATDVFWPLDNKTEKNHIDLGSKDKEVLIATRTALLISNPSQSDVHFLTIK